MKQFFQLLFLVILPGVLYSQNISVKSFRQITNDLDARVNYSKIDQNGEKCAIIKVQTTETGFAWDGDQLGIIAAEKKIGEYWLYIPHGAKHLTIKHEKLGILRNYAYSEPIQEAMVYELVLTTGKVVIKVDQADMGFVVITSVPDGADVFINDQHKGITPFQQEMADGEYTYRVEKNLYYTEAGKFTLSGDEGKRELTINFKPNFGYVEITTKPEDGMSVTIDGVPSTKITPVTLELKSGKHRITVTKSLFHEQTQDITIVDNQTLKLELSVIPTFGWIKVESKPEDGASVILEGIETGKVTPCRLERVASGEYTISLNKEWYEPKAVKVQVVDGEEVSVPVELQPTFGIVKITSDPESEIFIDNQSKGKGLWEGRLIAGWHTIEAKKDRHRTENQKIELFVGEVKEFTIEPKPMYGKLKIRDNTIGSIIKLNGQEYGKTPNVIPNLLVGDYVLTLEKQGYATLTKNITITDNNTTELNETLTTELNKPVSTGMSVTITSEPYGAQLTVDGKPSGTTPQNINLSYGNHAIKLVSGNKVIEETINIIQNGKSRFSYNVREDVQVTISSNPSNVSLTIDGTSRGVTPVKVPLSYGFHSLKLSNNTKVVNENINITQGGQTEFIFNVVEDKIVSTIPDKNVAKDNVAKNRRTTKEVVENSSLSAKDFINEHHFSITAGYHITSFSDKAFQSNLTSGAIKRKLGYVSSMNINAYPMIIDISYFASVFSVTKTVGATRFSNTTTWHRGGEFALNLIPFTIGRGFYLYLGSGYQLSQLYADAPKASVNTSQVIFKSGLKLRVKRFMIFSEYKYGFGLGNKTYNSKQISTGIGFFI